MFYNYKRDGITQSLLQTYMTCRMKAKLSLEGWTSQSPSNAMTYGTIIHGVLERVYNLIRLKKLSTVPSALLIKKLVKEVEAQWYKDNPLTSKGKYTIQMLEECCLIAEATLPEYFKFWFKDDFKKMNWLNLEQEFKIPIVLADGRKAFIRGKKDGVYGLKFIKLFETKCKSMVNTEDLIETLWFEFQVNIYLWAIWKTYKKIPKGVTYNIVRRTNIKQKVNESNPEYAERIAYDIKGRPEFYFIRLEISVTENEIREFEKELYRVVREFMDWQDGKIATYKSTSHCLDKYGACVFLPICSHKDYSNFTKRKTVFKELEDK